MGNIITLTTDFGLKDHYVGVMKGVMLSVNENARPVDITHCIDSHDIRAASFVIGNSYRYFPEKTVHLVVVDPGVGSERRPLAVLADGHFFVGPDNGVFSSVIRSCEDFRAREIKNLDYCLKEISSTFHGRDIFAPVAAHLSLGVPFSEIGPQIQDPEILPRDGYSVTGNEIRGTVVYTDKFGNLVTSIPTEAVGNGAGASVTVGGKRIAGISESYSSAETGEILAVGGSGGYIEISVNQGRACDVFGEEPPEVIIVEEKN
ncbi:MAG: SAM-dependent chlorinase/fluorinase [Candidatus Dadabacteria bacterium]|nr:SAM-dependent chlorinase/fluorinase [Candidatus Dadabacteria bacterium]